MERTRNKKPSAILTADWHLREDTPVCRTDDFERAQWEKVEEVKQIQAAFDCPVFHAGDLFNHWKPSPNLLSKTIEHLPDQFWTIYGNHDLPQHSLSLAYKTGIHTLVKAEKINILKSCHWGEIPEQYSWRFYKDSTMLVWHVMTYQDKKPWPGCTDPSSAKLLRKYPYWNLILTGHNHKSFTEEHEGRYLVNPGSLTRQHADQSNHEPCVYIWYAMDNSIEKIILKHDTEVITREHIDNTKERDSRIDAFISKLDGDWQAGMSFEDNLEQFYQVNKIKTPVIDIIQKSLEL